MFVEKLNFVAEDEDLGLMVAGWHIYDVCAVNLSNM